MLIHVYQAGFELGKIFFGVPTDPRLLFASQMLIFISTRNKMKQQRVLQPSRYFLSKYQKNDYNMLAHEFNIYVRYAHVTMVS